MTRYLARHRARTRLRVARSDLVTFDAAPSSRWWPRIVLTCVGVAIAVVAVGVGLRLANPVPSDREFRSNARDIATLLLFPDAEGDARSAAIARRATGPFGDQFQQSRGAYVRLIQRLGTQASGSIDATAIADRSRTSAKVLVSAVVVPHVRETAADSAVPRRLRLVLQLESADGGIKLADVAVVS